MTAPPRPYPEVSPRTVRDAYLIATALEDAAQALDRDFPLSARMLRARAQRHVDLQRRQAAHHDRQLDARSRWCSRSWKSGPLVKDGPAHVTVDHGRNRTTDLAHHTLCGKTLTGRQLTFGPDAAAGCPPSWTPCTACVAALTGQVPDDPHSQVFDEALDLTA